MPDYTEQEDIRKTGPIGMRGLRSPIQEETPVSSMSNDEIKQYLRRSVTSTSGAPAYNSSELRSYGADTPMGRWGLSKYDNPIMNAPMEEEGLNDTRYENQGWVDVLANGTAKMLGTAATTFVSSVLGVPYGLYSVATGLRPSAMWDNDLQQVLGKADEWLENNFKNYQSTEQQQDPHFRLGDMNWWADNVIKNMGFTIGAAAAGAVGAGALGLMSRAMGFVNNVSKGVKTANALASSLFAATGEGMIEARQSVEERNKAKFKMLEDEMRPHYTALEMEMQNAEAEYQELMTPGMADDPAYALFRQKQDAILAKKELLDQRRQAAIQEIEESGREMGNRILLGNQAFLTAGDFIQFGKGFIKSYDRARHMAEMSTKTMRPSFVNAKRVGNNISQGYKITGKNLGKAVAIVKNPLTEGNEEMAQQFISSAAGAYFDRKDINDYWRARLDPESLKEASDGSYSIGSALSQGFKESYGTADQWEQFLIGAMTGAMGTVAPTKLFNQDKDKSWINPARYFSWEGGIKSDLDEFNEQYRQYEENISDLNKTVAASDFPNKLQRLAAHTSFQKDKEYAAFNNDKKLWKDADDKQAIIDIQAFLRAGKLDDLRAIYNSLSEDMSDADIESILKMTTHEISREEDKANHDRVIDDEIAGRQATIADFERQIESLDRRASLNPGNMELLKGLEASRQKARNRIAVENQKIAELNAAKEAYEGEVKYFGPFLNAEGNYTKSINDVRQEIKHNAEELNRKLDSYLDSIDRVNRDTNGALTKEQEDNLAYLHNLGKESEVRVDKIMSGVRNKIPKKFRIKTNKTPEQLARETASSDLAFSKNDDTPEGYVEVDTSMMTDEHFGNFFIRDILMGGIIDPDFSKLEDEKGFENLSDEEKKEKRKALLEEAEKDFNSRLKEQISTVFEQIQKDFTANYKPGNGQRDTASALLDLYQDLMDARDLLLQAGQYRATLTEYMANPAKVEEDKKKEEKKNEEQTLKDKFKGKTAKDINNDVASGKMSTEDVDSFIDGFADFLNNTSEDGEMLKAAQDHKEMKATADSLKAGVKKAATEKIAEATANGADQDEFDAITAAAEMAEKKIDDIYLNATSPEDLDPDNFIRIMDEEKAANEQVYEDLNNWNPGTPDSNDISYELITSAIESEQENKEARKDIPEEAPVPDTEAPEETGNDPVTKVSAPSAIPEDTGGQDNSGNPVIDPVAPSMIDNIIQEVRKITNGELGNTGIWRNTTRRYQYHSTVQRYHDTLPKDSVEYKRSFAIHSYLMREGAFDAVENADSPAVRADETVIHFMVKDFSDEIFGKAYEELSDEDKNTALVILMLNDKGQIVGDLPLAKWEPSAKRGTPNEQVSMLMALEKKITEAFNTDYEKNHIGEAIVDSGITKDGVRNLNLTFKNGNPLVSRVMQVMNGIVPFVKREINNLNEIAGNKDFSLGISVVSGEIATTSGKNDSLKGKILGTKTGKLGTPYYLVKTSAGNYVPVPFYTPAFDYVSHGNTDLYRLLVDAVKGIITSNDKEVYKRNMDVIKGLLQVEGQKNVKRIFEVSPTAIKVHLRDIRDTSRKIETSVPNTGTAEEVAKAIVNSLSGTPINVSLQFINRDISTAGTSSNLKLDYNRVIGAIANMNLPKDTRHTVNSWFTIALATDGGLQRGKKVGYKTAEPFSYSINGKNVVINPLTFTAANQEGDPIYDEDVMLVVADVKTEIEKLTEPFKLQVGSEVWTYSPKDKKFTNKTSSAPIPQEEPASAEPQPAEEQNPFGDDFFSFFNEQTGGSSNNGDNSSSETFQLNFGQKNEPEKAAEPAHEEQKQEQAPAGNMTLEDINNEVSDLGILTAQTQDAWDAIPDDLKLKMYNEGTELIVTYGNEQVVISADNDLALERALKNINPAAQDKENISVEEAPKTMSTPEENTVEDQEEARRWLARNLPMLNSSERVRFVNNLAYAGKDGKKVWGTYKNSIIHILNNAPMGTVYHESFHYVVDMLLDRQQKEQLFDAAREQYGNKSMLELEENLAEDFRKYCITENARGIIGRLKRWFRRLKDAILRHNRIDNPTINTLFWNINNGKFAQPNNSSVSYDKYTAKVAESIHRNREKKREWGNLGADTRNNLREEGINLAQYSSMSLAEQEQWIKCRT